MEETNNTEIYDIIMEARRDIVQKTDIALSLDEMARLDGFLTRAYHMGWLDGYRHQDEDRPADGFEYEVFQLIDLHRKKNSDYGNAFSKAIDEIGFPYGLGMIYNKTQRLLSIHNKPNINFESAEDTLIDLASYAIMLLVEMKKRKVERDTN